MSWPCPATALFGAKHQSHPGAVMLGDSKRGESLQDPTRGVAVRTANSPATTPALGLRKYLLLFRGKAKCCSLCRLR